MSTVKPASSTSSSRRFGQAFAATTAVLLLVAAVSTEVMVRTQVEPVHNYLKYIAMFRKSPSPDAAFGSSVTVAGFSGQPGFVNMALGGEPPNYIAHKIRMYYKNLKPGRVIIQASYSELSTSFWFTHQGDGDEFEQILHADDRASLRILNPLHRTSLITYWRAVLSEGRFIPSAEFMPDGSRIQYARYTDRPLSERLAGARQTAQSWRPPDDPSKALAAKVYAEVLDFIAAEGGQACLVSFPTTQALQAEMKKFPTYAKVPEFLHRLAEAKRARYVDLADMVLGDESFTDDVHPNGYAAKVISPIIVERCFGDRPAPAGERP
ncbi:MAG: SGNH/GDSL hydrolase family protein [Phaeospirillum sp.]|nr:SGNH/GDSL hydrolase family protein [Phaeospirillum sp.]